MLWRDLRYGVRVLARHPGLTVTALLTLALGIGANTAIFTIVHAVLLRPLPFEAADRLVFVTERTSQRDGVSIAWPNLEDWRAQNHVFERIGVYSRDSYTLSASTEQAGTGGDAGQTPERLLAAQASADLFSVLRATAAIGRTFTADEDRPGAEPVVVLSHDLWQRRFNGNPSLIGARLTLNNRPYTIVGVMPASFVYPARTDIWVPLGPLAQTSWTYREAHIGLFGVARMKPDVTVEQARADMDAIATGLAARYPSSNRDQRVSIVPLQETYVRDVRLTLWLLLGAVGLVLLIACANVANLLLTRASARTREMAVRAALGADRWTLVRQVLAESVILSAAGGAAGLLVARWGVDLLLAQQPDVLPRAAEIGVDARVLLFALVVSLATGVCAGLVPALLGSRSDLLQTLGHGGRETARGHAFRHALVIAEVALTMMLLTGAGLLLRSVQRLDAVDPGFTAEQLLKVNLTLPARTYATNEQRVRFIEEVLPKLRAIPGVEQAAITSGLPLGYNGWQLPFAIEGERSSPPAPLMDIASVSPDYFRTMRIPVLRGRDFGDLDTRQWLDPQSVRGMDDGARGIRGVNAIVIDAVSARQHFPNGDAIGQRINLGAAPGAPVATIVGVVGRVSNEGLKTDAGRMQAYIPARQLPVSGMTIVIRSTLDAAPLAAAVRREVAAVDPAQPIYNVRTLDQLRASSIALTTGSLALLALLAALALTLAAIGLYGVVACTVAQRTKEIGTRVALGAQRRDVLRLIVWQGMMPTMIGIAIGVGASLASMRLMQGLLFGVSPADPLTFVVIVPLLVSVALCACWIPSRRAARLDPLAALRRDS